MAATTKFLGGKRKSNSKRSSYKKRQHGGNSGNSSTVAASHGGNTPMVNFNQAPQVPQQVQTGGNFSTYANAYDKVAPAPIPMSGGSVADILKINPIQNGGNADLIKIDQVQSGGNASEQPPLLKGGNLLNNIAVPAVLLYANNTFGKKKSSYTKNKRFRRNRRKSNRRFRA